MTTAELSRAAVTEAVPSSTVDTKLEVVVLPVSDLDRSKTFYERLGWRLDADVVEGEHFRVIQFTPPGSDASIIFGKNATPAAPGSAQGLYLVVSDIEAAREQILRRGVEISEIFHAADGAFVGTDEPFLLGSHRSAGPHPNRQSYRSYASFKDPDGNGWLLQEVTARLPGRMNPDETRFGSVNDLAGALRRAAAAHGQHEKRAGGDHSQTWPEWYAAYMVAEQSGDTLPS